MLSHDHLIDLCRKAGLTAAGIAYVAAVRAAEPARRVGGTRFRSVSARFASTKMGRSIQAESRTGEYPLVLSLELDDDVLEYYDQPKSISLRRCRKGRKRVDAYTADFLVLRSSAVELIEVKPKAVVLQQVEANPDEWAQRSGHWIQLPVAVHFDPMGIQHRVHLAEDIGPIQAANFGVLVTAKRCPAASSETIAWAKAERATSAGKVVTIHALSEQLGLIDSSPVLRWIALGKLFAADAHQLLTEVRTTRIFGTPEARDAFVATLAINEANDQGQTAPLDNSHAVRAALTDRQAALGLERYRQTFEALATKSLSRQQRRYLRAYEQAKAVGGDLLSAFVPRFRQRGNRKPRITAEQKALMLDAIENLYATAARRSARWVHSCIPWGDVPPVSYVTFCKALKGYAKSELASRRSGHRAAMAVRSPSHPSLRSQMPTAAWELVHIDHTKLDEKVWVTSGLAEMLDRPVISIAIDAWSRCVLSFWLSFSAPSAETLLVLVRDCVRRHGRLAHAWISDHGTEFGSVTWERFCATHGCTKFERPVAHPRSGAEVENFFSQLNSGLIHQLDGNMRNDQDWRAASASHKSNATARFSLEQIYRTIEFFLFDHYNRRSHGPQPFSPADTLAQSVRDLGSLAGIRQPYDAAFRVETAMPAKKRTGYRIDSRRGLRVGERSYWHDSLGDPRNHGQLAEVRLEPFDSSIAYAHIRDRWLTCIDARHAKLSCFDELGRWAQAALDIGTKPYVRAARKAADQQFARSLVESWGPDLGSEPLESKTPPDGSHANEERLSPFSNLPSTVRSALTEIEP